MTQAIRRSARGEACTLQIHPYCNGRPETTVLAHLPSLTRGMGLKSPDHWACYACSDCHDVIDQRNPAAIRSIGWEEVIQCMWRGLFRTQARLIEKGLLHIAGSKP